MRLTRAASLMGAVLLTAGGAGVASAQTTEPAPPSEASAVAARVGDTVAVADTNARAGSDAGATSATANALEVNGAPLTAQTGGTQQGVGVTEGALLDTGESSVLRVRVTPFRASVEDSGTARTSRAQAALVRLILGANLLSVNVLQSEAEATHTNDNSSSRTSSDTLTLDGLGLNLVLLHAEASSGRGGETYVASVNGTKLLTNDQVGNVSTLNVPGVLTLNLLNVTGGAGQVVASVADALALNVEALRTQLHAVRATGGGSAVSLPVPRELGGGFGGGGGSLATTGRHLSLAALAGLVLLGIGAAVMAGTRKLSFA